MRCERGRGVIAGILGILTHTYVCVCKPFLSNIRASSRTECGTARYTFYRPTSPSMKM